MRKLFEFDFEYRAHPHDKPETIRLQLCKDYYVTSGRYALPILKLDGSPFAVLSVNMPDEPLNEDKGEIFIKTWAENEDLANQLRDSEWFTDTGKRVPTGFVNAEVWILNERR